MHVKVLYYYSTFEIDHSLVGAFDHNHLVVGLVAFQLVRGAGLVAHKALVTLQHEDRPVDQIEIVASIGIRCLLAIGEEMAGFFGAHEFAVVG